ncbi:domeless-like protein 1, partial [Biomphalaria pfeifferi]
GTKPKKSTILRLVYFEQNSTLFLKFSSQKISIHWLDTYTVKFKQKNKPILELSVSHCAMKSFLQICECSLTDETIGMSDFDLNITVIVSRTRNRTGTVLHARKHLSFHFYDVFCPGPVINLSVRHLNHSSVVVHFELAEETKRNAKFMSYFNRPLFHRIRLHTTDSLDKRISFMTKFQKAVFQLSERPNQKIAVAFNDLSPHTNYLVSVTNMGAGGESDIIHRKFTTEISAPARPPVIKPYSFIRVPIPSHNETCLFIIWQPLPKHLHGGTNLHYKAELIALNTNVSVHKMATQHFLEEKISSHSHLVKLWAVNDFRSSEQHAEILIPPYTEMKNVKLRVNYVNGTTANVYVHMAKIEEIESLAVHWCHSQKSDVCKSQDICTGTLHSKQIEIPSSDHHLLNWTISFLTRCRTNVQRSKKTLVYEDFEGKDGVKSIKPVEADVVQTEYVLDNSDNGEDVETCSLKEKEDSHHVDPRVFFVSHKVRGAWSGMMSDVCYYDSTSDIVNIAVSQTTNNDMTTVLTFQQTCDTDPASPLKQFLILHYDIYASDNDTCHMKSERLASIENNLVSPVKFQIPYGLVYLCVVAVGQLTNYTHTQLIVNTDRKWQVNISRIFVATTSVIFVCLFIGLTSCCFFRKFWKRKNHVEKYFKTHPNSATKQDLDEYDSQTYQSSVFKYQENCQSTIAAEQSSNDSQSSNILNNNSCKVFSFGRKNLAKSPDTSRTFPNSSLENYSKLDICESADKVIVNAVSKKYNNEPGHASHLQFNDLTPHVKSDGLTSHEQFNGLTSHGQFNGLTSHVHFDGLASHEQFNGLASHIQLDGLSKARETNNSEKSDVTNDTKRGHLLSQSFVTEPCITSVDSYGVLNSGLQFCVPP